MRFGHPRVQNLAEILRTKHCLPPVIYAPDLTTTSHGGTALYWAARHGLIHEVNTLLLLGASPSPPLRSPLHAAARRGDADVCRVLLCAGADPGAQERGRSALQVARGEAVEVLVLSSATCPREVRCEEADCELDGKGGFDSVQDLADIVCRAQ